MSCPSSRFGVCSRRRGGGDGRRAVWCAGACRAGRVRGQRRPPRWTGSRSPPPTCGSCWPSWTRSAPVGCGPRRRVAAGRAGRPGQQGAAGHGHPDRAGPAGPPRLPPTLSSSTCRHVDPWIERHVDRQPDRLFLSGAGPPTPGGPLHPTPAQRRFLTRRDRTCRHPGCTRRTGGTDADHVTAYAAGGATDCANLCCLCRPHHRLKAHAPGWRFTLTADGSAGSPAALLSSAGRGPLERAVRARGPWRRQGPRGTVTGDAAAGCGGGDAWRGCVADDRGAPVGRATGLAGCRRRKAAPERDDPDVRGVKLPTPARAARPPVQTRPPARTPSDDDHFPGTR